MKSGRNHKEEVFLLLDFLTIFPTFFRRSEY